MSRGCKDLTRPTPIIYIFKITGVARKFSGRRNCPQAGHILVLESGNEVAQSCPTLCNPMDCSLPSLPGSSVHGISQQEYWSGLPFPSPEDLPDPGIEPGSPALLANSLTI